jgi:hypothetical protein
MASEDYSRWEMYEEDLKEIQERVRDHISEKYPGSEGNVYMILDCWELFPPDWKFLLGWVVFFRNRIVHFTAKWWSEGLRVDKMEFEEQWAIENIHDIREVGIVTERKDDKVKLYIEYKDFKHQLLECPEKHYDDPEGARYFWQKRQAKDFKDTESDLKKYVEMD